MDKDLVTDIAGIIGITSDAFQGSIAICFPEKTFLGVMEKMLGEKFDTITPDLQDGAGELINIIFGTAKRVLNDRGFTIKKALPSVVRGAGLTINQMSPTPVVMLPFSSDVGPFKVEIAFENQKESE